MLVTFSSKVDADIIMLGDHAKAVLSIAGKSFGNNLPDRGVFTAEQLPEAIHKIETAIASEAPAQEDNLDEPKPHPMSEAVRLGQRAYPLLQMMRKALTADAPVLWEVGTGW
jgi:hypothetical protein